MLNRSLFIFLIAPSSASPSLKTTGNFIPPKLTRKRAARRSF